ncbi:pyridoxamine 5'-phosphate oxidase family protein [Nocardioides antri]|uniref:Pyridoxamine 5'-phosphate oxidase family protein n=1 Tax=Nocardioides antri TaxID=2607659 RepID=A0A5B1M1B5_9ACTN|nr:pyridoxamine 5'-phosphate oxidase family protein [Nocardioides antri]KAA1426713.1 pyridoxamine 5'-phosphate oxidase family protein [Nocardioides antri]
METINLAELYDRPALAWDDVAGRLDAGFAQAAEDGGPGRHTCWLTSVNADGSPHTNAVGAIWHRGTFWFVTGLTTRRGRNLVRDPRCLMALSLRELDLVVEGRATVADDPEQVAEVARIYAGEEGWPCQVDESGTALTAPYSAQSAGPPPWHVFRLDPGSAHAVQAIEPYGATRWVF